MRVSYILFFILRFILIFILTLIFIFINIMSFRTAQHTRPPCVVAALGIKGYTMTDSALHYDGFASDIFRYGNTAVF